MKRRAFAAALGSLLAASSGCMAAVETALDASGDGSTPTATDAPTVTATATQATTDAGTAERIPLSWVTATDGDADATVVSETALDLRVHRCSTAVATTDLGQTTGTLRLSFDYRIEAEQWYEIPDVEVRQGGDLVYSVRDDDAVDMKPAQSDVVSGSVETTTRVDGPVTVQVRLDPSDPCDNFDHGNTSFEVRDLSITVESDREADGRLRGARTGVHRG